MKIRNTEKEKAIVVDFIDADTPLTKVDDPVLRNTLLDFDINIPS